MSKNSLDCFFCRTKNILSQIFDVFFCSDDLLTDKQRARRIYLWSFFLSSGLMMLIYGSIGIIPFAGTVSPLTLDMSGQYIYYFANFRNIVLNGNSLTYSWSRALGGEFFGMFAYYLASPLSLLVILFPATYITDAILLIQIVKIGLCGLTMSILLNRLYPSNSLRIVLFSTLYALNAFNIMYMSNIMWIDAVALLPLLTLGTIEILTNHRPILFVLALSITIITNYYMGFMACIFIVIYTIYFHIVQIEKNWCCTTNHLRYVVKSFFKIGIYTAMAITIAAIILLPAYYSLQFGKLDYNSQTNMLSGNHDLFSVISKAFWGDVDTVRPNGRPYIYCGTLSLFGIMFFYISKSISHREKIGSALVFVFFYLCFCFHSLDLLWYLGHMPNWLNYRYSYFFIFFKIIIAYKGFDKISFIRKKHIVITGILLIATLVLVYFLRENNHYTSDNIHIHDSSLPVIVSGIIIILVIFLLLCYYKESFMRGKRLGAILLAGLIVIEVFFSGVLHNYAIALDIGYSTRTSYNDFVKSIQPSVEYVYKHDIDFYRMEKTFFRAANDNYSLNIRGVSGSTSTLNSHTLSFLKNIGYDTTDFISYYHGGNPVSDSILGIRYVIDDSDCISETYYDLYYSDEKNERFVFKNPYALSLAFAVNKDILKMEISSYESSAEYINSLISGMIGYQSNVFLPLSGNWSTKNTLMIDEKEQVFERKVSFYNVYGTGEHVYIYVPFNLTRDIEVSINGEKTVMSATGLTPIGYFENGKKYEIAFFADGMNLNFGENSDFLFTLDYDAFLKAIKKLQKHQLNISSDFSETRIAGSVSISEDTPVLFTSIPYDANWKIWVDGEQVSPYMFEYSETVLVSNPWTGKISEQKTTRSAPLLDTFIAIELSPGYHEIVFEYCPHELYIGAGISLIGITLFVGIIGVSVFKKNENSLTNKN